MERCLEQCREELLAAAAREEGGVTSQTSFRTAPTSAGGSVASGLRSVVSGKLKVRPRGDVTNPYEYTQLAPCPQNSPLMPVETQTWGSVNKIPSNNGRARVFLFCFLKAVSGGRGVLCGGERVGRGLRGIYL